MEKDKSGIDKRLNLAQHIDGRWICTVNWVGRQSACKFFEQHGDAKAGFCKYAVKAKMNDSVPQCTNPKACHAAGWKSDTGGRRKFEKPRKLMKNRPPTPIN